MPGPGREQCPGPGKGMTSASQALAQTARGMRETGTFFDLYRHGFARTAVAVPEVRVADTQSNAAESIRLLEQAAAQGACLIAFPELGLTA